MALAGAEVSFLEAAIAIVAPVDGSLTRGAILDLERAEPGKARLGSAYGRISDRLEHAIDDRFRLSLCQVVRGGNLFGDLNRQWSWDELRLVSILLGPTSRGWNR